MMNLKTNKQTDISDNTKVLGKLKSGVIKTWSAKLIGEGVRQLITE